MIITGPGVYDGIPDDAYHADPVPGGSLSSTGARRLLPPSCPARYRYELDHPRESAAFDLGKAAHLLVLGEGAAIAEVDADNWRTNAAKEARETARAQGKSPLLRGELAQVREMAAAIRAHPLASALFGPGTGKAEQSAFWRDELTGIWCRARIDWLRTDGRVIIVDYKSCDCADPSAVARSAANYGYHQQGAFYVDGVRTLLQADPAFLLASQEKNPPYLVSVVELDWQSLAAGRSRNRRAIEIYRDCKEAGLWPGYSPDIELISLPPWAARIEEYA